MGWGLTRSPHDGTGPPAVWTGLNRVALTAFGGAAPPGGDTGHYSPLFHDHSVAVCTAQGWPIRAVQIFHSYILFLHPDSHLQQAVPWVLNKAILGQTQRLRACGLDCQLTTPILSDNGALCGLGTTLTKLPLFLWACLYEQSCLVLTPLKPQRGRVTGAKHIYISWNSGCRPDWP